MKSIQGIIKEKALDKNEWIIEKQGELLLVFSPLLKKYPNFMHAFTTRLGGQSKSPFHSFNIGINHTTDKDARQDARNNRELLCRTLNVPFEQLKTAEQLVHSTKVVMLGTVEPPGEVDGIVSKRILSPVYMTFADCVPIVIYDSVKHIFCLVHAGWRGTAGGISKEAVRSMVAECDSNTKDLVCAVGPAIGSCCYPVGIEAVEKLIYSLIEKEQLKEISGKIADWKAEESLENWAALSAERLMDITNKFWLLIESLDLDGFFIRGSKQIYVDLKAINTAQIMYAGIEQVDVTDLCTACKEDMFYSYRRSFVNNEGPTGRQAAIACLL